MPEALAIDHVGPDLGKVLQVTAIDLNCAGIKRHAR
jgi:hypothetical protein